MFAGEDPVSKRLAAVGQEFGHGFALTLDRIAAALAALGDPHLRLPPVIHVAGTNGKGSTCAFLRAIAEAAGLRVHVFTSPHLVRPNERIRLAGRLVDDEALIAAVDRLAATGVTLTYFEAVTAAAFMLFAETPADLVILEVGMGGRIDATNVIPAPAVTVVAPVDLDHQAFLGDTIAAIAGEKAGILKPGRPGVIARQHPDAEAVIRAEAERIGAPLFLCGQDWDAYESHGRLAVQLSDRLIDCPPPSLIGPHQVDNAGLAVAAINAWGDPRITDEAIALGVANAQWAARMQRLKAGPLAAIAAEAEVELFLDGGHNPHGARALARALDALNRRQPRKTALVSAIMQAKDARAFLAPLRPFAESLAALEVPGTPNGRPAAQLAAIATEAGFQAEAFATPEAALRAAAAAAGPGGRVLICGSLYLAGALLADAGGVS